MAFIRNTDRLVEGSSNKFFTESRAQLALQPTVEGLQSEDSGMKLRLDVIEGGVGVSGSIAKAQADAQAYADQKVAALVNSAPEVLDTLKELSDALGGDASFASTVAGQIGGVDAKVDQEILDRQGAVSAEQSERESADSALSGRLDVIEGAGAGSVAKALVDAKVYTDGFINSEQFARQSADNELDARLDLLEADPTTKSYVDGQIGNLTDINGNVFQSTTEFINTKVGNLVDFPDLVSYGEYLQSSANSVVAAEQERAEAAELALSNRIDPIEQSFELVEFESGSIIEAKHSLSLFQFNSPNNLPITLTSKVLPDFEFGLKEEISFLSNNHEGPVTVQDNGEQALVLYEFGTATVGDIVNALNTSVGYELFATDTPNQIVSVSEDHWYIATRKAIEGVAVLNTNVIQAEIGSFSTVLISNAPINPTDAVNFEYVSTVDSTLGTRISSLEDNSATTAYVDGQISAEQSRAEGAESALSGRLDALEADPVTKTYVDGEVSTLQGQIDTEKGRIDAILSASEADKDSFAEIVQLINSVDTSNDSAFASYVLSNDAALAQEVSDRQGGDSALSGRLDSLEADPTTKSYVDGIQSALDGRLDALELDPTSKSYVDGQVSALDSRLDSLEADPTTKSYVDSQISSESSARESEDLTFFKLDGSRAMTGGLKVKYAEKSANYTLMESDYIIGVSNVSGGKTMTLPSAVTMGAGKIFIIKEKSGAASNVNKITIMPQSGQTIDGESSYEIKVSYESISVVSDGSNWFVM